jgi:hypothetical protein
MFLDTNKNNRKNAYKNNFALPVGVGAGGA